MSSLAIQPPALVFEEGDNPAPYTYTVPGAGAIEPTASTATFDGTDAAGPFLAALFYRSQSGNVISRVFPTTQVAAGDVAQVSYAPFPGGLASTPGTAGITTITSDDDSIVVDDEGGGTVDLAVAAGLEEIIEGSATTVYNTSVLVDMNYSRGSHLLDYTNPQKPTFLRDGTYSLSVTLSAPIVVAVPLVGVSWNAALVSGFIGNYGDYLDTPAQYAGGSVFGVQSNASATFRGAAGAAFQVSTVNQDASGNQAVGLNAILARVGN